MYIYLITNDVNDKKYVGKTAKNNIEERWQEHCHDYKKPRNEKRPLYRAMRKYGPEHFHIEILEEVSPGSDLEEREIYWIDYYNSYHNGYNATHGGEGKPYLNYDLIVETYKQNHQNCITTARIMGCSVDSVRAIVKNYGFQPNAGYAQGKDVVQINPNTDEIIAIYPSIEEAKRQTGIYHINEVCNGKRKTAGGFKWEHLKDIAQ